MAMDSAQLRLLLKQVADGFKEVADEFKRGTPTGVKELNIVKVEPFRGIEEEDPTEWIDMFEKAAVANNWRNGRKIDIASGYLAGAAAYWYDDIKSTITSWSDTEDTSFVAQFNKPSEL